MCSSADCHPPSLPVRTQTKHAWGNSLPNTMSPCASILESLFTLTTGRSGVEGSKASNTWGQCRDFPLPTGTAPTLPAPARRAFPLRPQGDAPAPDLWGLGQQEIYEEREARPQNQNCPLHHHWHEERANLRQLFQWRDGLHTLPRLLCSSRASLPLRCPQKRA